MTKNSTNDPTGDSTREQGHRIEGDLTSDEVPAVWARHRGWQESGLPEVIDLGGVGMADSSGVALLLEWLAWARRQQRTLRFENAPESLRTIASLSQVDGLLGWKETER